MNLFVALLLCVPAAVLAGIQYNHHIDPDDYPDKSCNCIPLKKCQPVSLKLKSSHRRSSLMHKAFTNYLNIINCGFDHGEPLVCCPYQVPREVVEIVENKKYWVKSQMQNSIKKMKNAVQRAKQLNILPEEPKFPYQFPKCGRYEWREDFNGNATYMGEYPWLALLEYDTLANGKRLLCGGVLISDQHILTAAHCVTSRSDKLTSVILGEHDTSTDPDCMYEGPTHPPTCVDSMRKYDVDYTIAHAEYNDEINHRDPFTDSFSLHDIALVKLKTKVQITPYVFPICLPTKKPTMSTFKIAGWGRSSVPGNEGLNLKLMSYLTECNESESGRRQIEELFDKEEHICAGKGGRSHANACIVDSGGPLMAVERKEDDTARMTVFGISYTENTCYYLPGKPEDLPGVFTNVYNYKDWIFKYMNV